MTVVLISFFIQFVNVAVGQADSQSEAKKVKFYLSRGTVKAGANKKTLLQKHFESMLLTMLHG